MKTLTLPEEPGLSELLSKRQEKLTQIQHLKHNYLHKQVHRSDFYAEYESLGSSIYRINRQIYEIDPTRCFHNNF
jgi:hypothetical protein